VGGQGSRGTRSVPFDAVRVLAMLAILAGHVWVNGPARLFLYTWHVPIFFVLSGYLWKPNRSLAGEVKNRVRSVAPGPWDHSRQY
jgi:acyltransferase